MSKLVMEPNNIVKEWREAKDKKLQIEILADQNMCLKKDIVDILIKGGIPKEEIPRVRERNRTIVEVRPDRQQDHNIPKAVRLLVTAEMVRIQEQIDELANQLGELSEFLAREE